MQPYFIRHGSKLDIDEHTMKQLWAQQRIAIHFPHDSRGKGVLPRRDNPSVDPEDYVGIAKGAIRNLNRLAKNGGIVCAQYRGHKEYLIGVVRPNSRIRLMNGKWGSINGYAGRHAVLKTLRLSDTKTVDAADLGSITCAQPPFTTFSRWGAAGNVLDCIFHGRRIRRTVGSLTPTHQEVLCGEFLRLPRTKNETFPTVVHFVTPIGRTMKKVDIYGVSASGERVFAQVTYSTLLKSAKKMDALREYKGTRCSLVMFCQHPRIEIIDNIVVVPLTYTYERIRNSRFGRIWLRSISGLSDL